MGPEPLCCLVYVPGRICSLFGGFLSACFSSTAMVVLPICASVSILEREAHTRGAQHVPALWAQTPSWA